MLSNIYIIFRTSCWQSAAPSYTMQTILSYIAHFVLVIQKLKKLYIQVSTMVNSQIHPCRNNIQKGKVKVIQHKDKSIKSISSVHSRRYYWLNTNISIKCISFYIEEVHRNLILLFFFHQS